MAIPEYLLDSFKKAEKVINTEYKTILEEAKRIFSQNEIEIETYIRFVNENIINNQIQLQLESIKYLQSQIPDLNILQNLRQTNIESSDENLSFPIENVDDIVSIKKMVDDIPFNEAVDFFDFLTEYPMLGYKHEVGKKIFNFIENYNKHEINGNEIYRIRGYSKQRKMPYSIFELIGPPFGITSQNRFNNSGMNVTYFSENLDILRNEIGVKDNDKYSIIKVRLIKNFLMLDIRNMDIPVFKLCQKKVERKNDYFNIEYVLSNYISDCARNSGFDGIMYRSTIDDNVTNFVFFYLTKNEIEKIERVDII